MDYHPTWNLTTIPDALLWREAGRRASEQSSSHRGVSCACGECGVCRQRLYRKERRKAGKDLPKGARPVEQERRLSGEVISSKVDEIERVSRLLTIGHGKHSWETFGGLLTSHQVRVLVDVRSSPRSWLPHFNGPVLAVKLAGLGITYKHAVTLGRGPARPIAEQRKYIAAMLPIAVGTALMCSETDHKKCHRHATLAPLFIEQGIDVDHILPDGSLERDSANSGD